MHLATRDAVKHYWEAFFWQHARLDQEVGDVHIPGSAHTIFVQVPVWPCNNCTMRATVPLKGDNPALLLKRVYYCKRKTAHVSPSCVSSPYTSRMSINRRRKLFPNPALAAVDDLITGPN